MVKKTLKLTFSTFVSSSLHSRLTHSDIVLSNEDYMRVGMGTATRDGGGDDAGEGFWIQRDLPETNASRVDGDLLSYARSREALHLHTLCECLQNKVLFSPGAPVLCPRYRDCPSHIAGWW